MVKKYNSITELVSTELLLTLYQRSIIITNQNTYESLKYSDVNNNKVLKKLVEKMVSKRVLFIPKP